MKKEDILPLGSIVKIKGFGEKLLIGGLNYKVDGERYEYLGFMHPYGYVSPKKIIFFNSNVIEEVIFTGYRDEETDEFYEDLEWLYKKVDKEGK